MNFKLALDKWKLGVLGHGKTAQANMNGPSEATKKRSISSMSILAWEEWFLKGKRLLHGRNFSKMKFLQRSKENLQRKEECK